MLNIRILNNFNRIHLSKNVNFIPRKTSSLSLISNQILERSFFTSTFLNVEGKIVKMPSLSPTMMEGAIVKWLKQEGDTIAPGDIICDIQTDKAVVSFEVDDEGLLAKILVQEDAKDVKVGTVIALMVEEGEDWKSVEMPASEETDESLTASNVETTSKPQTDASERIHFGPSVRLLLEKYDITPEQVTATGPHGALLKGDVLKMVQNQNLQPKPIKADPLTKPDSPVKTSPLPPPAPSSSPFEDIELTNMRKIIAKRLTESKGTIAHTYSTMEATLDTMLSLRKKFKNDGATVSVNDLIIKSVAAALVQCPEINCVWEGNQLKMKNTVDISVAVATPSGLITPIVRGADGIGVQQISDVVRELASRAKENRLKPEEFQGGTFTISNLGMFGIKEFTAIINPPQCAILAVGGGRLGLDEDGNIVTKLRATLSYDQMAISDDSAAKFLSELQSIIEDPLSILLGQSKSKHPLSALL